MDIHVDPQFTPEEGPLTDTRAIKRRLLDCMVHVVGRDPDDATERDWFYALAYLLRGILGERLMSTARAQHRVGARRVYYLSMEYLIGRRLHKTLLDLGMTETVRDVLSELGVDIDAIAGIEFDAALGNGGLGRLAACFLDSLATHGYPGYAYGIRYEFGMFTQRVEQGQQVEQPENWLRYGNPWEFERPGAIYPVRFGGRLVRVKEESGVERPRWVDTDDVIAMAFDMPISGYRSTAVTNLRLWAARSSRDLDLKNFNEGNYIEAVRDKTVSENLSKVLYPNDATEQGQQLRLRQEYFFVSASIQDILSRYAKAHGDLAELADHIAIQLNDTHPALAIPELMRLLVDVHGMPWRQAWEITGKVFSYTNHTLLPEALETWPIHMLESILPRHLDIVFQINEEFLKRVHTIAPGDVGFLRRTSLIEDHSRRVRMAHLAIVGSRKVNGVAELHADILKTQTFPDFDRLYPEKFIGITNGITHRRWLTQANPELSALVTDHVGEGWKRDLTVIEGLVEKVDDPEFHQRFRSIKLRNKERLASVIDSRLGLHVDPAAMFDVQIKRIHEYKRQLLNLLHVISRYNDLRDGKGDDLLPRVVIISGKAAPGYFMAKLVIRLVNDVAQAINNDKAIGERLKVVFIPDYNVSAAELIIPASDLSEQISTAGTEASGTGNMKLALNGSLTIGTLDGANIEILEEVGAENIFIFGLEADGVEDLRVRGYDPWKYYQKDPGLKRVIDMIGEGFFSPDDPSRYQPLVESLLKGGDRYFLLADYASYLACQRRVDEAFRDSDEWTRKAILNVAHMGKFSSDRAIHGYARDVWDIAPIRP